VRSSLWPRQRPCGERLFLCHDCTQVVQDVLLLRMRGVESGEFRDTATTAV
jgi:hypothetical protein